MALAHHHVAVVLVVILVLVVLARPQALAVLVVPVLRHTQVAVLDCLVKARLAQTALLVLVQAKAVQVVATAQVPQAVLVVLMVVAVVLTVLVAVVRLELFGELVSHSLVQQIKDLK